MPIPEFTTFGLLPEGVFNASLSDIADRYLGNPNRSAIWQLFDQFLTVLEEQAWYGQSLGLYLDGGFTSDKPVTKDIDVVIDLSAADDATFLQALNWCGSNHDQIKQRYAVDLYIYHPKMPNDLRAFFGYVKGSECVQRGAPFDTRKGLLFFKP